MEGLFFSIADKKNQYNSKYRAAAKIRVRGKRNEKENFSSMFSSTYGFILTDSMWKWKI